MRYFPAPATAEQTKQFILRMSKMYEVRGYCYFPVELLETGQMIGFIGLMFQEGNLSFYPAVDIGWRLSPMFWGKGLATEGAKRCLDFAFNDLNLDQIISTAPKANLASTGVMKKIGMQHQEDFLHPKLKGNKEIELCEMYSISKPKGL